MRLLCLRLKNINSLRGEHQLFFDKSPLNESGLFGIVGATGSGKSTLLDCITLALYGRVPRFGLVSKTVLDKGGVILTKHEKECYAEVKYSCKKGVFTASWSVGKTRNNTFRNVEMKVFNESGDLLSESLSTAPEVNIANIGLDYDQFVKSILLCQGDFARFLQSDRNKRAELLEKITGTRTFRKIGIKAYRAYNIRKGEIEVISEAIRMTREGLLSEEERASLIDAIKASDEKAATLIQLQEQAKLTLAQKKRLALFKDDLEQKRLVMEKAAHDLESFGRQYAEALSHYDKLFPFKEDLSEHLRLSRSIEELNLKISAAEKEKTAHDAAIAEMVAELGQWVKVAVSDKDYFDQLDAFRDRVMDAIARKREQQNNLKATYERIMPLLNQTVFSDEKALFRPTGGNKGLLDKLRIRKEAEKIAYEDKIRKYDLKEESLDGYKRELMEMTSGIALLQSDVRSFTQHKTRINNSLARKASLARQIEALENSAGQLQQELTALESQFRKAEKEKEQMLHAEKLDELRASLVEGEPCPLCGAEHHPYVHAFATELLNKTDEFEKIRNAHRAKKDAWEQAEFDKRSLKESLEAEHRQMDQYQEEISQYAASIEHWKQQLKIDRIQNEEKIAELLDEHKQRLAAVEWCMHYQQKRPQFILLENEVLSYDSSYTLLENVEQALTALYRGDDFQREYQLRKDAMKERQDKRSIASEQERINTLERQAEAGKLADLEAKLLLSINTAGYTDIDTARKSMISEAEQRQLLNRQKDLLSAESAAKSVFLELSNRLILEAEGDDPGVSLEEQETLVTDLQMKITELGKDVDVKKTRLGNDDQKLEDISKYETERNKQLEALRPWEMLNKLIGDARGNVFNTKAQELTLQHLLILANRRMNKLHGRYTLLLPEKPEDDDLRVSDSYMGGEIRTVRSLSGGETFVLSLALALGLSDLASRDIRIDSLFVDEGFGSLDPDTLEEAMSTLEQLQAESNKMVGIISHVESLKERIYTQIRLEKSNNGFSTISIYPETETKDEQEASY